jgi:hypothetical protein
MVGRGKELIVGVGKKISGFLLLINGAKPKFFLKKKNHPNS